VDLISPASLCNWPRECVYMLHNRKKDVDDASGSPLEIGNEAQRYKSKCFCAKSLRGMSVISFICLVIFMAYRYDILTSHLAVGRENAQNAHEDLGAFTTDAKKGVAPESYIPKILKKWKEFAVQSAPRATIAGKGCSGKYLRLYGAGVGESSNHIFTLANALAVADSVSQYVNYPQYGQDHNSILYTSNHELPFLKEKSSLKAARYTLLIPAYITKDLEPFTLKQLQSLYCVEFLADGGADDKATREFLERHAKKKDLLKLGEPSAGVIAAVTKMVAGLFKGAESQVVKHDSIAMIPNPPLKAGDIFVSASNVFYWGKEVPATVETELESLMSPSTNPHISPEYQASLRASGSRRLAEKNGKGKSKGKGKGKSKGKGSEDEEGREESEAEEPNKFGPAKPAIAPGNVQERSGKKQKNQAKTKNKNKMKLAEDDDAGAHETDDVVSQQMDDDQTDDSFEDDDRDNAFWVSKDRGQKAVHRGFTRGSDFLFVVGDDLTTFKHEERISNGEYIMQDVKPNKKDKQPNLRILDPGFFARYSAGVLAALWADIKTHYKELSLAMSKRHYGGRFTYSSVHKRSFEGTCSAEYTEKTYLQRDFQPLIGYDEKVKKLMTNMRATHPVCSMSPVWVIPMIRRKTHVSRIYIASDGQTDDSEWDAEADKKHLKGQEGIVVGHHEPGFEIGAGGSVFDMFNAVLAQGVFLGSPRSTYSLAIYILRAILTDRINIPLAMDFDMYFNIHVEKSWKSKVFDEKKTIAKPKMEVFGSIPGKTWMTRRIILNTIEDVTGLYQRR